MYKETTATLEKSQSLSMRQMGVIAIHAFIGWALCAATMGIGMAVTSMQTTLIIHAIGAPIFFGGVSFNYFKKYRYTSPLKTAIIFVSFVIVVDFFLVAMVINKSFDMFLSPLGTWIPFALIFASTYLTGAVIAKNVTS
jgi:hypothetical protein